MGSKSSSQKLWKSRRTAAARSGMLIRSLFRSVIFFGKMILLLPFFRRRHHHASIVFKSSSSRLRHLLYGIAFGSCLRRRRSRRSFASSTHLQCNAAAALPSRRRRPKDEIVDEDYDKFKTYFTLLSAVKVAEHKRRKRKGRWSKPRAVAFSPGGKPLKHCYSGTE